MHVICEKGVDGFDREIKVINEKILRQIKLYECIKSCVKCRLCKGGVI